MYNPNFLGANTFIGVDINPKDLVVNFEGKKITDVITGEFNAKPYANFSIPFTISFSPTKIVSGSFLDILDGIRGREFDLNLKGNLKISKFIHLFTYKLDVTLPVKF